MPKGKPANSRKLRRGERLAIAAAFNINPNQSEIAEKFNVSRGTVQNILKDTSLLQVSDKEMDAAARGVAAQMLADASRTSKFITDQKLSDSSAYQLTLMRNIAADGYAKLVQKPSLIVGHVDVTSSASDLLAELKRRFEVIDVEPIETSQLNDSFPSDNATKKAPETAISVDPVAEQGSE